MCVPVLDFRRLDAAAAFWAYVHMYIKSTCISIWLQAEKSELGWTTLMGLEGDSKNHNETQWQTESLPVVP